jgi:diguanylate cyclase (GGDEF)-like protein/PAS domain S-box-containing protein
VGIEGEVSPAGSAASDHTPAPRRLTAEQRAALLDDTVDMLVVLDARGMLVHANLQATRLLGWTPGDVPVPALTFVHPDDRDAATQALEQFVDGMAPMHRKRLRVGPGPDQWTWVEVLSRNRLGVPGVDGIVITARDVTDQVVAERQLLESEQRFRSLVNASADAVVMLSTDGTILYSSPQADVLLGGRGQRVGPLPSLVHPDDEATVRAAFRDATVQGLGAQRRVVARLRDGDDVRWIESWVVNQLGVPGVDALVVYGRDITAQRSTEEALRARVEADELVARISARFVEVGADEIEAEVSRSLAELGGFCQADRAWIFQLHPDGRHIDYTFEWCASGITSEIDKLKGFPIHDLPGFAGWIGDPRPLLIRSVAEMGTHLESERAVLEDQGIRSLAAQAMFVKGELYGIIGLDAVRHENTWPDQVVWALDACAHVFGSAMRRCEAETALAVNEARFRAMFDRAADGVRVLDADMRSVYSSPAVARIIGYPDDEVRDPGTRLLLVHPDDRDFVEACRAELRSAPGATVTGAYRLLRPDGTWAYIEECSTNLLHDPAVQGFVVNMRDITERRRHEDELVAQARRDLLTGLPNRLLFDELLDAALARAQLTDSQVAVVSLDLDRFKLVNESLGHQVGDAVLQQAATRLRARLRRGDVVARVGSDEFVLLCEPVELDELGQLTDSVVAAFQEPFRIEGHGVYTTVSVGVAISGGDTQGALLLRQADSALTAAKQAGGNRAATFSGSLGDAARARLDVEATLRVALAEHQLRLHYQPIISVADGSVVGAEALLRWDHPTRGLLGPDAFLEVAEETGLIGPIGAWVIGEACRQLARWRDESALAALALHVNVSVRQLRDGGVAETLRAALAAAELEPEQLFFEITESALLAGEGPIAELEATQALGVGVALDDFGTGHSSLSYLRTLAIDVLKIDREFIDGLTGDGSDAAIVTAIVNLARSLGLGTVGEGVETEEQAAALAQLGCDQVQGYWYSRPLPPEEFQRFVTER